MEKAFKIMFVLGFTMATMAFGARKSAERPSVSDEWPRFEREDISGEASRPEVAETSRKKAKTPIEDGIGLGPKDDVTVEDEMTSAKASAKRSPKVEEFTENPPKPETVAAAPVETARTTAPTEEKQWTKRIGDNISLRATTDQLYIKAGETLIVLDQAGKIVIHSADTLNVESKKDILFKAGGDIRFESGGQVVTSSRGP